MQNNLSLKLLLLNFLVLSCGSGMKYSAVFCGGSSLSGLFGKGVRKN
jgi:hypothetical protein